jgi:hypothetical protein
MSVDPIAQNSCPIPLSLTAIRADSIDVRLRLIDASTSRPIALTGYTGEAKIWASINADVALHSLTVEVDQAASGQPDTGLITITAAPGATILWKLDGFWSLTMVSASVRKTIVSGPWQMHGLGQAAPSFVCGVCPVPGLEQVGTVCSLARDGVHELRLPYPQSACGC